MSPTYKRLRRIEVPAPTAAEKILFLVSRLEAGNALDRDQSREAAHFLGLLLRPKGRVLIDPKYAKRSPDREIALDYLATYRRLGKSAAAELEVAKAWGKKPTTINRYWKKYRHSTELYLRHLVGDRAGKRALADLSNDIREMRG